LIVPLGCDTTRLWKYDISYRKRCFRSCLANVKFPWFGKIKDTKLVLKSCRIYRRSKIRL